MTEGAPLGRLLRQAALGLLALALISMSVGVYALVSRYLKRTSEHQVRTRLVETWERRYGPLGDPSDRAVLQVPPAVEIPDLVLQVSDRDHPVRWLDGEGKVVFQAAGVEPAPPPGGPAPPRPDPNDPRWRNFTFLSWPLSDGGRLEAGYDPQPARDLLKALARYLILVTLGLLAAGWWLSWRLTRRLTSPVVRLVETVRHLAEGDLSARPSLSGAPRELQVLARDVEEMATRLEASFEKQKRFVADASHELRTPLTAIEAMAEMLESAELPPEQARRAAATVVKESRRMSELVSSLLALARAEHRPAEARCNAAVVAAEVVEEFRLVHPERQIELHCPVRLLVKATQGAVRGVLRNLLENALRYSSGPVEVRLEEGRMSVSDQGIGIAPEHLPHIFERFYRADAARHQSTGGSGLGLSIVQALVRQMGASIEVDSHPGEGTSVLVKLP